MATKSHIDIIDVDHYDPYMAGYVAHNRACDKHERSLNEHRAKLSTLSRHPTIGATNNNIQWGTVALSEDPETASFFCATSSLGHTIAIIIIYTKWWICKSCL